MSNNAKPAGAAVNVVVIGVDNLDASLKFYAGTLGLDICEDMDLAGA
jgi:catechol 2,3-dioxygenase-like lactoylglutathione lyase family enzyme